MGHYLIERPLGAGGMGEVFVAFDESLQRRVALKLLPPARRDDESARARILREARAASALRDPRIVTVYEVGEHEGIVYIAMELIEGETFADLVERRGKLPRAEAFALIEQVGAALSLAHAAGILHRDVKSANLMLEPSGGIKVLDFGLSKRLVPGSMPLLSDTTEPPSSRRAATLPFDRTVDPGMASTVAAAISNSNSDGPMTEHGLLLGTPGYAAPELLAGVPADARSDVYSLGVVLYELLTGARPYVATTLGELSARMRAEDFPRPSVATGGALGSSVDAMLARALRADPNERYATVAAFIDAARAALTRPERRPPRRAIVAVALVLVVGVAAIVIPRLRAREPAAASVSAPAVVDASPRDRADIDRVRAMTTLGGCAYAPTFAGDRLVFDETLDGADDLFELRGDAPYKLASTATMEFRASPGSKPGEIIFIVTDQSVSDISKSSHVGALDLDTGAMRVVLANATPSAVYVGDSLYYSRVDQMELRRFAQGVDTGVLTLPPDRALYLLTASPDGRRLAAIVRVARTAQELCLIDLEKPTLDCVPGVRALVGRPAFSPDSRAVYYASATGVRRFEIATRRDDVVVPGKLAPGGVAVAPDGRRLVYSDCAASGPIVDVSRPERPLIVDEPSASSLAAGPDGLLAYVRTTDTGKVLVVRRADATSLEIPTTTQGTPGEPSFDTTGARIAFVVRGPHPGIYVADLRSAFPPSPITTGPHDSQPVWLRDGRVVFVRPDDAKSPILYTVRADGMDEPKRASPRPRIIEDTHPTTGEVLVSSPDNRTLYLWDAVTGRERPVAERAINGLHLNKASISRDGAWLVLQSGAFGSDVWKVSLGDPTATSVRIFSTRPAETMDRVFMLADGRVAGAPRSWRGELFDVPAAAGSSF